MLKAHDITCAALYGEEITLVYRYAGESVLAMPTLSAFASFCEKEGCEVSTPRAFWQSLPDTDRRVFLADYMNSIVGMERKEAYALGMCAAPGEPASTTLRPDVLTSCPEDEAEDCAHLLRPVRSTFSLTRFL